MQTWRDMRKHSINDFSLGRLIQVSWNRSVSVTERIFERFSGPEAAFSNAFSSASPSRRSFFERLAVPNELFRSFSRLEGALSAERAEADGGALKSKLEALREAKAAGTEPTDELAAALGPQVIQYARKVEEAHETNDSTSDIAPASARDKRGGGSSARSEGKKKSKLGVRRWGLGKDGTV